MNKKDINLIFNIIITYVYLDKNLNWLYLITISFPSFTKLITYDISHLHLPDK